MASPYINFFFTKDESGNKKDIDYKDRSPDNQVACWKNKANSGKTYFKIKVTAPGEYTGFINKYYEEDEPAEEEF
jgi:hypothetical protein